MNAHAALMPPAFMPSDYASAPRPHVATLPGMTSVAVNQLFPSFGDTLTSGDPADMERVRAATRAALANVDMSRISADDSVNILASEHGFGLMGGWPYAEMV